MKRLLGFLTILLILPGLVLAQETKLKKIMIFPFKVSEKGAPEALNNELSAVLASQIAKEGDLEVLPGMQFSELVREKRVDLTRVARIAARYDCMAVIWGTLSKLEEGYALEVSVMGSDPRKKPHHFSATGKDMEDLLQRMKDLAAEIGTVALDRPKIGSIRIEGNRRVPKDSILNKLRIKEGDAFRKSALSDEIRDLYAMGYFDDVQIRAEDTARGEVDLHISLKERPSIKEIETTGNKQFTNNQVLDEITTKQLTVASTGKIRDDIAKLKKLYEKEGYHQPKIDYEIKELSPHEAKLIFKIDEGAKSYVTEVAFEGRNKVDENDLFKLMTVKPKSWFWFLDESGTFSADKLEENRMRIMSVYLEKGFINAQVGAPKVDIKDGTAKVTYPIREGDRFQIRKVDVEGDLLVPKEKLLEGLQTKEKTWFKRSALAEDIKQLARLYNNMGYAYVDVEPRQQINDKHDFIDFTFRINKGQRVSIERVDIVGNERTRDKVIRRALAIGEGDLYNADLLDKTKGRLQQTEFFEEVKLKTTPGSKPDLMNLTVEVTEKKTGSLVAGLGYSSQDGAMGTVNLKERNLFGLGIVADGKANISGSKNSYEGSVTYPWLFDYPLSASLRGYKSITKEQYFVRDGDGFSTSLSHPLYGEWMMTTSFAWDSNRLTGFDQTFAKSVVNYYRQFGANPAKFINFAENSVSVTFSRDTRDGTVIPTEGSRISVGTRAVRTRRRCRIFQLFFRGNVLSASVLAGRV